MKKFMRIALVFALAGATLMYTGCTKDYSGDISDLNKKVSEQTTAISALQSQVATALSEAQKALSEAQAAAQAAKAADESAEIDALAARVTTLEAAMQSVNDVLAGKANASDLAEAKAALEGAIASINDVLAGKADAAEVAATYATIEALAGKADKADLATVKAALEALQASVAENKEAFDATKTALEASIATINAALEGKADKAEVAATYATIAALTETNNSLAALQATVAELTETVAANKTAGEAADAAIIADLAKANEAIVNAVAAADKAVADLKAEVTETLKGYYTKAEIDALIGDLSTSLFETVEALAETNNSLATLDSTVTALAKTVADNDSAIKDELKKANQAIADAVVASNKAVADLKAEVKEMLKDYYTKAEIDALVEGLNTSLDNLKKYINGQFDSHISNINVLKGQNVYVRYARWDGVQEKDKKTGKWVAAEWEGPRADEAAAEEFGGYVTAPFSTSNKIDVQINPTSVDLSTSEFVLEDAAGFQAPVAFGEAFETPVKVKGANGLWSIPFVTGDFDAATVKALKKKPADNKYALVVDDNVRSTYNFSFNYGEVHDTGEAEKGAEFGKAVTGQNYRLIEIPYESIDGEWTIEPSGYATLLYDAYITATRTSAIVKYGVEFDGMTLTYDAEAVLKGQCAAEIDVVVKQLSIAGYISEQKVKVIFESAEEPEPTVIPVFCNTPYHVTATPVVANQTVLFDASEFIKAIGSADDRLLWADEFTFGGKAYVYENIFNKYDELIDVDSIVDLDAALTNEKGGSKTNNDFTHFKMTFDQNYVKETFDKEYTALLLFKNGDGDVYYEYFVPFVVDKPTAEEVASWFSWDIKTTYISNSTKQTLGGTDYYAAINLGDFFKPAKVNNAKLPVALTYAVDAEHNKTTAFVKTAKDESWAGAFLAPEVDWKGVMTAVIPENEHYVTYYKFSSSYYTELFKTWQGGPKVNVLANKTADYTITGLKVAALGREFAIDDVAVSVVRVDATQEPQLSFTPSIELERGVNECNFWTATNSAFKPYGTKIEQKGEFTLTGSTGNVIAIACQRPAEYNAQDKYGNWYKADADGEYGEFIKLILINGGWKQTKETDILKISLADEEASGVWNLYEDATTVWQHKTENQKYTKWDGEVVDPIKSVESAVEKTSDGRNWNFNTDEYFTCTVTPYNTIAGSAQSIEVVEAYGLNFALRKEYTKTPEVIRVKLTFKDGSLVYVANGQPVIGEISVEFDINMK